MISAMKSHSKSHSNSLSCTLLVPVIGAILAVWLSSCFLMRKPAPPPAPDPSRNIPRVSMSEDYMRSRIGDIMVFLPKTWFLVNTQNSLSTDVQGVAVNPSYSASLVLQTIRSSDLLRTRLQREGLGGLARYAFDQRASKSPSALRLLSVTDTLEYAGKRYGYYEFSTDTAGTPTTRMRSAVCLSSERNFYEISLVPTTVTVSNVPSDKELNDVFQSLLVTSIF